MKERLEALKAKNKIKWKELAELLDISVPMLGCLRRGERNPSKKLLAKIVALENRKQLQRDKQIEEYRNRSSDPAFIDHMARTKVLSPEEICAQHAMLAYRSAQKVNLHSQFETLMMWLRQSIEDPQAEGPPKHVAEILDRIRRRDYPQYKEPKP